MERDPFSPPWPAALLALAFAALAAGLVSVALTGNGHVGLALLGAAPVIAATAARSRPVAAVALASSTTAVVLAGDDGLRGWSAIGGVILAGGGATYLSTRRERAERATKAMCFRVEAMSLLAASLDYEQSVTTLARIAVPNLADGCVVHLMGDDGVIRRAAVTHVDSEAERRLRQAGEPSPGTLALALARSRPERRTGTVVVPLQTPDRVLGTVTLVSGRRRRFRRAEVEEIEALTRICAIPLDSARRFTRQRDRNPGRCSR